MITANVYNRVFFVRAAQYGSAFIIDVDQRQYLVTARHLLDPGNECTQISLFHDKQWKIFPVTEVGRGHGDVDIAVLSAPFAVSQALGLSASGDGLVLGQDVYFVGYPYKMWTDAGTALAGRPCPFIKKGTLSSAFQTGDAISRLYIDAINNEGFSGGPVVFVPPGQRSFQVAGVVSAFRIEYEPVLDEHGDRTSMSVPLNTGFLIAYDIAYAVELAKQKPVGLQLKTAGSSIQ